MTTQHHQNSCLMISSMHFLLKSGTLCISRGKKLDYLHFLDFLKYDCESCLKQPLTPPYCKIFINYRTQSHRLVAIRIGRWSTLPIFRVNRLCQLFCSHNGVQNEARYVMECPQYKPIRNIFNHYARMEQQGVSSLSPKWTITPILSSISWRLPYSTLGNQSV